MGNVGCIRIIQQLDDFRPPTVLVNGAMGTTAKVVALISIGAVR